MRFIILSTIFIFLAVYSNAQTKSTKISSTPTVTKGYYSIGRNADKLNNRTSLVLVQSSTYHKTEKGYYTIHERRYKLPKFYSVKPASGGRLPVQKGYYNIGSNNEKIK